jgi:hypothetical protein
MLSLFVKPMSENFLRTETREPNTELLERAHSGSIGVEGKSEGNKLLCAIRKKQSARSHINYLPTPPPPTLGARTDPTVKRNMVEENGEGRKEELIVEKGLKWKGKNVPCTP